MGGVRGNLRGVVLCEDRQHSAFIFRFLEKVGYRTHGLHVPPFPDGGSAEQWVREQFPKELRTLRSKGAEQVYLIVMIDGDDQGVDRRRASLKAACREADVPPPTDSDRVLICVPTWNIETWIAYLGGETVEENRGDYPKLERQRECRQQVNALVGMCQQGVLRDPAPSSLEDACHQYRRVFG